MYIPEYDIYSAGGRMFWVELPVKFTGKSLIFVKKIIGRFKITI
jgi:hypothetical protein